MAKNIKNVLLVRNAYTWQYGGAERFTLNMAQVLGEEKLANPIIATSVTDLRRQAKKLKIPAIRNIWMKNETHRRWAVAYYGLFIPLVLQYAYFILRHRIDVVTLMGRDEQIFGSIAAKLLKKRVVWIDHGDMKGIFSEKMRFMGRTYQWALSHADEVVAVSRSEREKIVDAYPERGLRSITAINNGALHKRQPTPRTKKLTKSMVVTYIGRIEEDKGMKDLLAAATEIAAENRSVMFYIVGKGSMEKGLKDEISNLNLSSRFKFFGQVDDVYGVLDQSDLFVYPTHHEAAGIAPLEALLSGVPVVATNVGGIPEMVTPDVGVLVPPHQPVMLKEAILGLISNPDLLRKMGEQAIKNTSRYDFREIVNKQYRKVLGI